MLGARAGRPRPGRPQAGARLLDGEPARLHGWPGSPSAATTAALFHLLTHAAFKALLFLAAGAVIHAVGTNLMSEMGGLRRAMPVTFVGDDHRPRAPWSGLPLTSGFFSKDAVLRRGLGRRRPPALGHRLAACWRRRGRSPSPSPPPTRPGCGCGRSSARPRYAGAPHEAPALMSVPVVLLAIPALALGAATGVFPSWRRQPPGESVAPQAGIAGVSVAALVVGAAAMYLLWRRRPGQRPGTRARAAAARVRAPRFYVDAVYAVALVRPVRGARPHRGRRRRRRGRRRRRRLRARRPPARRRPAAQPERQPAGATRPRCSSASCCSRSSAVVLS